MVPHQWDTESSRWARWNLQEFQDGWNQLLAISVVVGIELWVLAPWLEALPEPPLKGHSAFQCPLRPHARQVDCRIRSWRARSGLNPFCPPLLWFLPPYPFPLKPPPRDVGKNPRFQNFSDNLRLASWYAVNAWANSVSSWINSEAEDSKSATSAATSSSPSAIIASMYFSSVMSSERKFSAGSWASSTVSAIWS